MNEPIKLQSLKINEALLQEFQKDANNFLERRQHKGLDCFPWLHVAEKLGVIKKIEQRFFTYKNLTQRKSHAYGKTTKEQQLILPEGVIHGLARKNKLEVVPENKWTGELVSRKTENGNTVLHEAAKGRCLNKIPERFINREILRVKGEDEKSCYHLLAENYELETLVKIDTKLLVESDLLLEDRVGKTPLDYAEEKAWKNFPVEKLSAKTLLLSTRKGGRMYQSLLKSEIKRKRWINARTLLEEVESNRRETVIESMSTNRISTLTSKEIKEYLRPKDCKGYIKQLEAAIEEIKEFHGGSPKKTWGWDVELLARILEESKILRNIKIEEGISL